MSVLACTKREAPLTDPDPRSSQRPSDIGTTAKDDSPVVDAELERICVHSYEVLIVATGMASAGVRRDFVASCVAGAQTKREALGELAWAERVGCILAGETADDLGRCDGREPPSAREPAVSPGRGVAYAAVCEHIITTMEEEFGAALIPAGERPKFLETCAEQLEQEAKDNPQESERQARCMLEATSFSDFERCAN
ncbi:hypothetical protein [Enhygromyxa salina]|uniref:hypothetical protein n=1 Tax=Enhygromyxa salina TaxID=215803 RepID=UPI0011B20296|nr:hypothetical protein [Enhygromyxa salina]